MTTKQSADYLFALGCLKLAVIDLADMVLHVDENYREPFASIANRVDESANFLRDIYQQIST